MANSIQAPWIKKNVLSILREPFANRNRGSTLHAKIVQVIDANAPVGTICVSDKSNFITVMLTPDCVTELTKQYSNLSDIRHSFVKLVSYHFTSTFMYAGLEDGAKYQPQNISFPLVMQCAKLHPVGGYDCAVLGNPCDINADEDFKPLRKMNYVELTAKLGARQFPKQCSLPNADGEFQFVGINEHPEQLETYHISADQKLLLEGCYARLFTAPKPIVYNETLVDETQRDEVDDVEDDSVDPSGGLELVFVDSQLSNIPESEPMNLRKSTRNQKVKKVPDEMWFTQPMTQECDTLLCEDTPSQSLPSPLPLPLSGTKKSPEVDSNILGQKIRKTVSDLGDIDGSVRRCTEYLLECEDGDSEGRCLEDMEKLPLPEPPLESDAVAELEVEEEAETRDVSTKDMDAVVEVEVEVEEEIETGSVLTRCIEEVKNTASNDRPSCSSAMSSSSSAGSWRDSAEHQHQRALGDIFIRYVDDQDGVRQTLRGKDADSTLYEAAMRLDHYDSCDEEDLEGMSKEQQRRRKYSTMSCGYAPDGSIRRLPKKLLRYSRESLITMFEKATAAH